MNHKRALLFLTALFVLLPPFAQANESQEAEKEPPEIVLTIYPDPAYTELIEVGEALADGIDHRAEFLKKAYADGREEVMNGDADGMLITKRMNAIRLEKAGKNKGKIKEKKLTIFTPIARKIIKSEDRVLDEVVLGIASVKRTTKIQKMAEFGQTKEGERVLKKIPYMAPVE